MFRSTSGFNAGSRNFAASRSRRRKRHIGLLGVLVAAAVALPAATLPAAAQTIPQPNHPSRDHHSHSLDASRFHGVNWADPLDNFANGPVIPSGLSLGESYATTYRKAHQILRGFRHELGANTVRLPVNPYSVGTTWWRSYRATIDAARHEGFSVILSYWEGTGSEKDGRVDNTAAWYGMWDTLTRVYQHQRGVYFEPMNEPYGYSSSEWQSLAASWVQRYTERGLLRDRIFVSGTGYNDHTNTVCTDPAFAGTYVSQHYYGYWGTHDEAAWSADLATRLGDAACSSRTIIDEFGAPMTTGINYLASSTASDAETNNSVAFMHAVTATINDRRLGGVYWPGLRNGDSYSLTTLSSLKNRLRLTVNSETGLALLKSAWGQDDAAPAVQPTP